MKALTVRVQFRVRTYLIEPGIKLEKVQPPTVKMGWRETGDQTVADLQQLGLKPVVEGKTVTSFEGDGGMVVLVTGMGSGVSDFRTTLCSNITHAWRSMNVGWDGAGTSASFFLVKLREGQRFAIDWRSAFQISPATRSLIQASGDEVTVTWK